MLTRHLHQAVQSVAAHFQAGQAVALESGALGLKQCLQLVRWRVIGQVRLRLSEVQGLAVQNTHRVPLLG